MYHYKFTNDLRISKLNNSLSEAAHKIITDSVPSASDDKSANNNISTLSFYFNLIKGNNCSRVAANGNVRKVVLNFIKKFQFPNPRTFESYDKSNEDEIKLAPMRLILKLLYIMSMNDGNTAILSKDEIKNFIFYNSKAVSNFNPDIVDIYLMIKEYRKTKILPDCIETDEANIEWKHQERQLREMIKILTWSGCVVETEDKSIKIHHSALAEQDKADIFEIVNYYGYWDGKYPYTDEEKKNITKEYQLYMDISNDENSENNENNSINDILPILKGNNLLIYGVPGCGKSYYIKSNYDIDDKNSERVIFHPDYTYSDFVGQILPRIKSNLSQINKTDELLDEANKSISNSETFIEYIFVPGPFTRLIRYCENDKNKMNYLIIEEINRGNAAAIFGDIFQLLDRNSNGESEYGISNYDIANEIYFDGLKKVKIPNNLTIIATMNTADQNIFILDTAFKRRWEMLSIKNDFKYKENDNAFNEHLKSKLCGTELKWMDFANEINQIILEEGQSNLSSEDKRLGHFFVKKHEMKDTNKFSEKVIMYLWNDVFKFEKERVFDTKYKSLEDILEAFRDPSIRFKIFNTNFKISNYIVVNNDCVDEDKNYE